MSADSLTFDEQQRLRALIRSVGIERASDTVGVSIPTMLRARDGMQCRANTLATIREVLPDPSKLPSWLAGEKPAIPARPDRGPR